VPQVSVIMEPCANGVAYSAVTTDFTITVEGIGYMFVTGPNVVKTVTHEEVDSEYLGGAETHATISGIAHLAAADEATAMDHVWRLLAHVLQNNLVEPTRIASHDPVDRRDPGLDHVVPDDSQKPYDMHDAIRHVVDDADFLEIQPGWARTS
jgi:acetyl-CoA carboxylase carboxyltransferase component